MTNGPAQPTPEEWLRGTPYLVAQDSDSTVRFWNAFRRSVSSHTLALEAANRLKTEAQQILEPFARALRTDLVAESNRLEGYEWTRPEVRDVVETHRELVEMPRHGFLEAMRQDAHLVEALGLYRAYSLADTWLATDQRPREYEIRGLHAEIVAGAGEAGQYKSRPNRISGSTHVPIDPFEVSHAMSDLAEWWVRGSPDPVLDATVVHAWLTHVHPFEDGNGRLARVLANLALTQRDYPPLVLNAQSDRGQYLDALAASDHGDILPLYDLIATTVRRAARLMGQPGYARELVEDRLLQTDKQKYEAWYRLAAQFTDTFRTAIRRLGWDAIFQGYPDLTSYALLRQRRSEGNSWHLKVLDPTPTVRFLMFWGYASLAMIDGASLVDSMPSIFFSVRRDSPTAVHPYEALWGGNEFGLPDEITLLLPTEDRPVLIRRHRRVKTVTVDAAARELATAIVANH